MNSLHHTLIIATAAGLLSFAFESPRSVSGAESPTELQVQFFEKSVRPLLVEHCYKCHSEESNKGKLRLDTKGHILLGGESGPAIQSGKPDESLLMEAVRYESYQMPPDKKLDEAQIAILARWIEMGAPWPGDDGSIPKRSNRENFTDEDRAWWAFQKVQSPKIPTLSRLQGWGRNDIDHFIAEQLEQQSLSPAPEADRSTLLSRLYFDLIGLPPTPEEIRKFELDTDPLAYEKAVDHLLSRPEYGERWARHWLDLVRYAESDGFRADNFRSQAWRYRDYVIQSLNEDKPYDRFVEEQIAGDELYPDDPAALTATGFLRHGMFEYNVPDVRGQCDNILNEMTDVTADVFLGLGFQCARCHDHKFDPILQKDYFRLRAFFEAVLPSDEQPAATSADLASYTEKARIYEERTRTVQEKLDEKLKPHLKRIFDSTTKRYPDDLQEVIKRDVAERTPQEQQFMQFIMRLVKHEQARVDGSIKGEEKDAILELRRELAKFDSLKPSPLPLPLTVRDVGPTAPVTVIPKKNIEVQPGFLSLLDPSDAVIPVIPNLPETTGRRAVLAKWLTNRENPLTPRVIVNRVWQYHFSRGLAANSSDLGRLGDVPSHPELLDWLTLRFLDNGWKLKDLHRLIVTSATYRQSSLHPSLAENQLKDPTNRYYWRGEVRRLDAEQIRDSILAVTGRLDSTRGGPSVQGDQPRRSIYTRVMRNSHDPLLQAFDLPLFITSTSNRNTTTSPIQSLLLINSQTMLTHATNLANRTIASSKKSGGDAKTQVEILWSTVLGRSPTAEELAEAVAFLEDQKLTRSERQNESAALPNVAVGKVPYRDGQAALFQANRDKEQFLIPPDERLNLGNFTIEMYFQLRSIYETGEVRTLATKMPNPGAKSGWLFAITGKGSRRKPQTLVLQMFGKDRNGRDQEALLFSDHHVDINKPYYAAATVRLAKPSEEGKVVFYLKDLSNDDEPVIIHEMPLNLVTVSTNTAPMIIGNRDGTNGRFDGLIDDIRLSSSDLPQRQLLLTTEGVNSSTVGYWQFEPHPGVLQDTLPDGMAMTFGHQTPQVSEETGALIDLCHVLLNSNEFLYVD
ncbi:DUF1553 domain-containing protein [Planctomicrobium sp. SH527]|uniref:DUF1553 domain-containing protein n=1 Tax=Planctomicrobium sp. SH527 TaxID=3448123 RepID=UPI003F5AE429